LQLAQKYPSEPLAIDALERTILFGRRRPECSQALDVLLRDHVQSKRLGRICALAAILWNEAKAEKLLRAVLEKNSDRAVQGQACLSLAHLLKDRAEMAKRWRALTNAADIEGLEEYHGKALVQQLREADPERILREVEGLYERVLEEYGDVKRHPDDERSLGDDARSALLEMRQLGVGKTAPEIKGEDIDGKPFQLSDYRGKIIVLVFCGHWCGPCRAMYPYERSLVKRMEGKPFALLGVNSDKDRDEFKKVVDKEQLTWRSWWDGGSAHGPIARSWNVSAWPTVYVLDTKGVIRHKDVFDNELGEAVESLLSELESAPAKRRP
jgi:peroxiredoxin